MKKTIFGLFFAAIFISATSLFSSHFEKCQYDAKIAEVISTERAEFKDQTGATKQYLQVKVKAKLLNVKTMSGSYLPCGSMGTLSKGPGTHEIVISIFEKDI